MTLLAALIISIACALFWTGVAAPATLRVFGVPVAFGVWRLDRRNRHLSRTQYVWAFGVFSWAVGMFFFSVVFGYLRWKLLGEQFAYPTPRHIAVDLLVCLLMGWVIGVLSSANRNTVDPTIR